MNKTVLLLIGALLLIIGLLTPTGTPFDKGDAAIMAAIVLFAIAVSLSVKDRE